MAYNSKMLELGSRRSVIREIFEYSKLRAAEIGADKVFDFSLGNPSVPAPKEVKEALIRLSSAEDSLNIHGYTSAQGDLSVRRTIAEKIRRDFGASVRAEHIYMTCGAAASLSISLKALIEEGKGEECIVFAPFFTEYRVFVANAGAKLVICPPDDETFGIDISSLEKIINQSTKAVIVNSPNNPSGVVYTEENLSALCELLKRKSEEFGHPIYLISDEPYRELVYSDTEIPYLTNYYPNTVVCYSYSKSLSLPGERIGYIALPENMDSVDSVYLAICGAGRSLGYVCAPSIFQKLVAECVDVKVNVDAYKKNRDTLYEALVSYGYECVKPDGAFYLLVKAFGGDAYEFYEKAKKHEILVVPCDDFGVKGYVRIAYCTDYERIVGALPAFQALAKECLGN